MESYHSSSKHSPFSMQVDGTLILLYFTLCTVIFSGILNLSCLVNKEWTMYCYETINISLFSELTTVYFILPEVGCCKRTGLGVIQCQS